MHIRNLAWVLAVAVVAGGVVVSAQGQDSKARDAVIGAAIKKIKTGDAKEQTAGRIELADVYYRETTAAGQASAAAAIAKQATPAINELDGQGAVMLGIAISQIHDAAVQPAIEAMIRHKDAAIRVLGWRSYLWSDPDNKLPSLREQIVKDPAAAAIMWKSLAERMGKENVSAVFGFMFDMMRLPTVVKVASPGLDAKNYQLLEAAWKDLCQKIVDGDDEATRSARSAITTMEYFYKNDKTLQNKIVAHLVEMMYCAAKSYDLESAEGELAEAAKQAMLDTEAALEGLDENLRVKAGGQVIKAPAARATRESKVRERGPAAMLAALDWADSTKVDSKKLKKDFQPKIRTKVTTQPVTQPATAPSK